MVFVKNKKQEEDATISVITGRKIKAGDVGIEIEVEGRRLPVAPPLPWVFKRDGSLRGAENAEYVLNEPIPFDDVSGQVDALWELFKTSKTQMDASNRTSIHVHLNVLPFYMNRLTNLVALWYIHEDLLAHWCGEYRVGNLFALRAKDAPAVVRHIRRFIELNGKVPIPENNHYAGCNAHAINKFGSLEFRTLRGTEDKEVLKTWVAILRRLYDKSADWKDPRELVETFSLDGPMDFFYNTFGPLADTLRRELPQFTYDQVRDSLMEGVRIAQDICYARDWSNFNPVEVTVDPFGRKKKKTSDAGLDEEGPVLEAENTSALRTMVMRNDVIRPRRIREDPVALRFDPFAALRIPEGDVDDE